MTLVIILVVLALLFGVGAVVEGLFWAVLIAVALAIAAVVLGLRSVRGIGGRGRSA